MRVFSSRLGAPHPLRVAVACHSFDQMIPLIGERFRPVMRLLRGELIRAIYKIPPAFQSRRKSKLSTSVTGSNIFEGNRLGGEQNNELAAQWGVEDFYSSQAFFSTVVDLQNEVIFPPLPQSFAHLFTFLLCTVGPNIAFKP